MGLLKIKKKTIMSLATTIASVMDVKFENWTTPTYVWDEGKAFEAVTP